MLPQVFSREKLSVVKRRSQFWRMKRWGGAIARSEYFAKAFTCLPTVRYQGKL
ncbi:hypothetical protein [Cylindrospermopsis raciborskii]|uniref:hypothetical protein n=1 Tax=Cylindrospermopsis raciborskii TaxID=77022 RepID=UPI0015872519|nr:hypothetical protein [Cylindrospermopsis raciborskii]